MGDSEDAAIQIGNYLSGHFPNLRELDIWIGGWQVVASAALVAPVLEELSLRNFTLCDWGAHVVGNLTSLALEDLSSERTGAVWTLRRLLAMLQLSGLTVIDLRGLFDSRENQERINEDLGDVELPNLGLLVLMDVAFALLSCFRVFVCRSAKRLCCSAQRRQHWQILKCLNTAYRRAPRCGHSRLVPYRDCADSSLWQQLHCGAATPTQCTPSSKQPLRLRQLHPGNANAVRCNIPQEHVSIRYRDWGTTMIPFSVPCRSSSGCH